MSDPDGTFQGLDGWIVMVNGAWLGGVYETEELARRAGTDLRAAVAEAYREDGQAIWWRAWDKADAERRRLMECGVLAAWSGQRETR